MKTLAFLLAFLLLALPSFATRIVDESFEGTGYEEIGWKL